MTAVAGTHFSVDSWDPGYGSSMEAEELARSGAEVELEVEVPMAEWAPIDPSPVSPPDAVLFVDGVRRIDARVWIDDPEGTNSASIGLCASYAAGVVCCCDGRAHVIGTDVRRGVFTVAPEAADIATTAGVYRAFRATAKEDKPLAVVLSSALQEQLAEAELDTAVAARTAIADHVGTDLLVVDGPLSGRTHLPRAVGFIKSHQTTYLPGELNAMVGGLAPHQRTPVFLMGTTWVRHSWYLRLPSVGGPPWSGVVRVEAAPHLGRAEVAELANLTQSVLGRFASVEYKDSRAPQNLYPIAGLERDLRHRLGDQQFVYRALRRAATR
ncbi:hypothetical protein SAMN05421837_108424 [Amycolatopsis pretoriensis]|uniref:NurA domain-containing protein n=1 Tax=Amycolatopsis pretoriensis TaxID=218821 RepID=A0A1H5RBV6_9PSEU|nr:hypothetical protein [Amycolatopsis pretoriensis]SEF35829.1 hypothetical protein SAMN05421837_108424 [Amycolatopsis pretoriensis]